MMEAIEMSPSLAKSGANSFAVVVDALPYIDVGYDEPGVREAVSFKTFKKKNILACSRALGTVSYYRLYLTIKIKSTAKYLPTCL
jgi:hypothetical protein